MLWHLLPMLVPGGALACFSKSLRTAVGWVALTLGLAVSAVHAQHVGPDAWPDRGNRLAAR